MKQRHIVPERMDDPNLDEREHQRALGGLRRINWFSGTGRNLARCISDRFEKNSEISVLDLGCGSGDVALDLASRLQNRLVVNLTGWDMSPIAIKAANAQLMARHLHTQGRSNVNFEQRNAIDAASSFGSEGAPKPYDVVYCTLFMHHFTNDQSVQLLQSMKRLSKGIIIVDDLKRSRLGWCLAKLGCHLLSRSPVVHFDGPQSVRAAYSAGELLQVAEQAGLRDPEVKFHWPERFLCCWNVS